MGRIPIEWAITLGDFSAGMIEQARQNLATSARPFTFEQFDAQAIPFTEDSFDAVIANHMLYHVPNRQKVYAEVKRVLKPGGLFYAATNSRNTIRQVSTLETRVGIKNGVKAFYDASDFTLENGEADLALWFERVTLCRQEETLRVTEAQPLIDYIHSVLDGDELTQETVSALRDIMDAEIREHEAFQIDRISGLFIAEKRMMRVIVIVLDGCGVGALPDAAHFGADDVESNTLGHVAAAGLTLPNLQVLGLGNIVPLTGVKPTENAWGGWGKMAEMSAAKDSVTGHWEMMGTWTEHPFPTYPNGFPSELIAEIEQRIGRKTLGNIAASGTEILARLGPEHLQTGFPIVYTSADSVFQIAAHEDIVQIDTLYEFCTIARDVLIAPHNIQRVIARPFVGDVVNGFRRTEHRRDFPLPPPEPNVLSVLADAGRRVHAVGVVAELFPKKYFSVAERTQSNEQHLNAIERALQSDDFDFLFANCEDFDMLYGHRNDPVGFARALESFDARLGTILNLLQSDDLLILCADHGNDPTTNSTDHSREYSPLLAYGAGITPGTDLGTRKTFADVGATVAKCLGVEWDKIGTSLR